MNEKRSGGETVETNPEDLTLKTTANQYLLYYFPLKRSENTDQLRTYKGCC